MGTQSAVPAFTAGRTLPPMNKLMDLKCSKYIMHKDNFIRKFIHKNKTLFLKSSNQFRVNFFNENLISSCKFLEINLKNLSVYLSQNKLLM